MEKSLRGRAPPFGKCRKKVQNRRAVLFLKSLFISIFAIMGAVLICMRAAGISADVVLSGSMEPVLPTGGIVFTDKKMVHPLPGDIITYRVGETKISHRLIRTEQGRYITKGDMNDGEDAAPVEREQLEGTVIGAIPWLGYGAVFFQTKTCWLFILSGLFFSEIVQRIKRD